MSYATELANASRTPQQVLELGMVTCENFYATPVKQLMQYTEDFGNAVWVKTGATALLLGIETAPDGRDGVSVSRIIFNSVGDTVHQVATGYAAANNVYTGSIFLAFDGGTGTITLEVIDASGAEAGTLICTVLNQRWHRFSIHRKFTGAATGDVRLRLRRDTSDYSGSALRVWGGNLSPNPNTNDGPILFPYIKRTAEADTVVATMASRCQAADAGATSRCFYSFPTCQDTAHFNGSNRWLYPTNGAIPSASDGDSVTGIKRFRFCRQDSAVPVPGSDIWPLLKSLDVTPQKIDPEKAVTQSEAVNAVLYDVPAVWNWNQDKASAGALTNPAFTTGHLFRRFMRIYRNYSNPYGYAKAWAAFVASGLTEADFQLRGRYIINNMKIDGRGLVTVRMTDRLKLLKTKAPAKISDSNLVNGAVSSGATSIIVDDASELTTPAVNAAGSSPDYFVTIMIDSEFFNVTAVNLTTNTLTVQPGRWGSSQASHADNTAWKEVLMFGTERSTPSLTPNGKNPIDIVIELLRRAGLTTDEIDVATLQSERDTWLASSVDKTLGTESGVTFKRAGATIDVSNGGIAAQQEIEKFLGMSPVGQVKVLNGLRPVTGLDLWVNESQIVTGRLFAPAQPSVTLVELTDANDLLKDSIEIDDNEVSRITRVIIGYDLASGKTGDNISDYSRYIANVGSDEESPSYFGDSRTLAILSPWIRAGDSSTAKKLAKHIFARYRQPARNIMFDLELRGDTNKTGDFCYLTTNRLQLPDGTPDAQRIIALLSKTRKEGRISFESVDVSIPLGRRYAFICPNGYPNYDAATTDQRRRAFIADANLTVGTKADPCFFIW